VRLLAVALLSTASLLAAEDFTYRNTKPGVAYIGSRMCADCHAKIYQDYIQTAMGRSMNLAASSLQRENITAAASIFSEKINRHFEVSQQAQDIFQSDYELDMAGREVFRTTYKLEYVIGSGVNGYTFLVRRGDYLFQAPLSYYSRKKSWDLSPGYEFADYGFNRPVAAACIACHSGQPQPVRNREGLFANPPFRELAIGCENCHGPGALHAAGRSQATSAPKAADRTIINPRRLPARLAEDICMNCHQGGDTRILAPGKDYFDFRPGVPLRQTLAIVRIPLKRDAASESDLLEHHFSMQLSACYRASRGRLSCLTCHQVHGMPRPEEAAAYYRNKCLTCHAEADCKLPKTQRVERADNCAGCHMPKRDVETIAHSALTNHRIISRLGEPLPAEAFQQTTADLPDLVYLNRPIGTNRASLPRIMLLQAYGELMDKDPAYQPRYFAVLEELSHAAPAEPMVEAALGRKALQADPASNATAIDHLTRAIKLGFTAPAAYQDLAEAQARADREADAVATLQHGIELAPYAPPLYKSLALRYIHLKQYAEARKALERYVELFPEDDFVRGLLLKVKNNDTSIRR
jgi:hypothetical protein